MATSLFSEFAFSNKDTWKKQAEKELGENYNRATNWEISENLHLNPYYTDEEIDKNRIKEMQNCQKKIPGWLNIPYWKIDDLNSNQAEMVESLQTGADGLMIEVSSEESWFTTQSAVLKSDTKEQTPLFWSTKINSEKIFKKIAGEDKKLTNGGIANDPLANRMRTGADEITSLCAIFEIAKRIEEKGAFRPLMIESHVYHNAGADPVQELGFLMASVAFYLDQFTENGFSPEEAFTHFFYSVSIGTEYLTEIAKLRALRYLHRKMAQAYGAANTYTDARVHAQTSSFYHTRHAAHTNIARTTSEAMSAVIGGCDLLTVLPFSEISGEQGRRIAKNTSSLLTHEGYLNKVADPAAGSYLLETLSLKLADAAWDLFLKVESRGGIIPSLNEGYIQSEIEKTWSKKTVQLTKEKVMVGVNKYRQENEEIPTPIETKNSQGTLPQRNLSAGW